jgi:FKBP-type peptidyl-prolyl isomerase-like protein
MSKILFLIIAVSFLGYACKKEEPKALPFEEQRSIDSIAIEQYLIDNNISNILKDCNTVFVPTGEICDGYVSYVLHEEGIGLTPPDANTKIIVSYTGRLMTTNEQFDANDTIEFNLAGLIPGWQAVLLDMQEGDSVTMYIPSVYGYGFKGTTNIPSNANLIFEMKLHQVN